MNNITKLTISSVSLLGLPFSAMAMNELNDTGLGNNNYSTEESNYYFDRNEMTRFPGQDPEYGRDAAAAEDRLEKVGGGRRGFDFSKAGDCVVDNVTGLTWEVKTNASDDSFRSNKWTYTWHNANVENFQGLANGGVCFEKDSDSSTRISCDTASYVAKLNEIELCGYSDWRLPSREELRSIADYSQPNVNKFDYEHILPSIDKEYFPNTINTGYWTTNVYVGDKHRVWTVDFENGGDSSRDKKRPTMIRLVSDANKGSANSDQQSLSARGEKDQGVMERMKNAFKSEPEPQVAEPEVQAQMADEAEDEPGFFQKVKDWF